MHELGSLSSCSREETKSRLRKLSESGFFLNDKKRKFSLILEQRFKKTSSKPILIGRRIQEFIGIVEFQRREIDPALARDEELRRDQHLLHEHLSEQNRDLREAHMKSLKVIEDRDTIHELTARLQELQNEVDCMNDSRDCKDAESVRSASQLSVFPYFRDPGGMLSRSVGMLSRNYGPPSIWDTWYIGKRFVNPPKRIQSVNVSEHITACGE